MGFFSYFYAFFRFTCVTLYNVQNYDFSDTNAIILHARHLPARIYTARRGVGTLHEGAAPGDGRRTPPDRRVRQSLPGHRSATRPETLPGTHHGDAPRIRQTQLRSDGGRRADQEYRPLRMVSGKGDRNGHRPYHPHRMPPQRTPDAQTRTGRTGSDKCRQAVPEGLPSTAGRTDARRGSDRHTF